MLHVFFRGFSQKTDQRFLQKICQALRLKSFSENSSFNREFIQEFSGYLNRDIHKHNFMQIFRNSTWVLSQKSYEKKFQIFFPGFGRYLHRFLLRFHQCTAMIPEIFSGIQIYLALSKNFSWNSLKFFREKFPHGFFPKLHQ